MKALDVVSGIESAVRAESEPDGLGAVLGWERLLDAIPGAVLLVGPGGIIAHANQTLAGMTGYQSEELRGRAVELLVPDHLRLVHFGSRTRYQRQPQPRAMGEGLEAHCRRADGSTFPVDIRLAPLPLEGGTFVMVTVADQSERRRREDELFSRAVHDPLTGLPNRVLLVDRTIQALARARRQGTRVSILYLDVDGFKEVNDRWGHGTGDVVLRLLAQRLAAAVRPSDTVARLGGDEFVVLCDGLPSPAATSEIPTRLLEAVAAPIEQGGRTVELTASVGIASSVGGRSRPRTLIEAADRAMYRAKRAGGGRYRRVTLR